MIDLYYKCRAYKYSWWKYSLYGNSAGLWKSSVVPSTCGCEHINQGQEAPGGLPGLYALQVLETTGGGYCFFSATVKIKRAVSGRRKNVR